MSAERPVFTIRIVMAESAKMTEIWDSITRKNRRVSKRSSSEPQFVSIQLPKRRPQLQGRLEQFPADLTALETIAGPQQTSEANVFLGQEG